MRTALVTGVSRGIGHEVAKSLLADGWRVLGVSRSRPLLTYESGRFSWACIDVSRPHRVETLHADLANLGTLDALIHCAAVQGPVGRLDALDAADWLHTLRVNLDGAYLVTRVALPFLRQSDDARVLLFSGGGAFNPRPNFSAYAASKAGVVALAESLAVELRQSGITVNCVAPGLVPTAIHQRTLLAGRGSGEYASVARAFTDNDGRAMATALDCVRHLLSDATRGLTGKTVSAPHDDWRGIDQTNVDALNASRVWTRDRVTAAPAEAERVA